MSKDWLGRFPRWALRKNTAYLIIPKCASRTLYDASQQIIYAAPTREFRRTAFVRHPADRLLSAWSNKSYFFGPGVREYPWLYKQKFATQTIEELLEIAESAENTRLNKHIRPQSWFVDLAGGVDVVKNNLDELKKTPRKNTSEHPPWQTLPPDLIRRIERRYEADVELYHAAV